MKVNGALSHVAEKAMGQESQSKELISILSTPKNGSCLPGRLCPSLPGDKWPGLNLKQGWTSQGYPGWASD